MTTDDFSFLSRDSGDPSLLAEAVRDSHALLKLAEKSAGIGIWDTDLATDMVRATPTFFRIMGLPPSAGPVPNDTVRAVRHPDDAPRVAKGFRKALAHGLGHYEVEYRIVRPSDGALRWIFGRGRIVRDKAGTPVRYSGVDIDITDRKRAEQQLRESEERFSKAFNAAAHPMSITTLEEGRYVDINAAGLAASGLTRHQVIGRTVRDLGFYNDAENYKKIRELLATEGRFTDLETTLKGRRGPRTYLLSGALVDLHGEACLLTSAVDITERKQAEEHVRLLMHELNHRANNLLTIVQALTRQTANTADPKVFAERLSQRLAALAASNDLLVSGKWQGVGVAELVASQLSPFADLRERVALEGPEVRLTPAAAQAIGMALHELATNAAKYGALSCDGGRISVRWSCDIVAGASTFTMAWSEHDGPVVKVPGRVGFGRTIIERLIAGTLDGTASLDFAPTGVTWSFACPSGKAFEG